MALADRTVAALDHKPERAAQPGPSTSNASEDRYDAVYFDSDDEDEGTAKSRYDALVSLLFCIVQGSQRTGIRA